jgi:acetyl esterase/lipase
MHNARARIAKLFAQARRHRDRLSQHRTHGSAHLKMMQRTTPRARFLDIVRVVGAALLASSAALLRRLFGRKRRPSWGLKLELLVAVTRGAWSVMPRIGLVRWRNVGERMSPLRTGSLVPRFVRRGDDGSRVDGAWLEPPDADPDGPVILYFHGGGFVFASLRTHGDLIAAIACATKARTFALDYRLAPEHPMPAALDDALASYRDLLARGIPASRVILIGDSAGGNLVLSVLLGLRDRGEPMPAAGIALSPWVDLACSGASFQNHRDIDFVGEEHCRLAAAAYLAGADAKRADISPLFARLSGLPPLLIHAGEVEALVDQIRAFVARARADGVDVTDAVYPDMVHVWHMLRTATPEAQRAIDEIAVFARNAVRDRAKTASA